MKALSSRTQVHSRTQAQTHHIGGSKHSLSPVFTHHHHHDQRQHRRQTTTQAALHHHVTASMVQHAKHIPTIAAAFTSLPVGDVSAALNVLIVSLGGGNGNGNGGNFGGGGNGGNGHGGGGMNLIDTLIRTFFSGGCFDCKKFCSKKMTHAVDMKLVVRATEGLVRAMDVTVRKHKHTSLVKYLNEYIKNKVVKKGYNPMMMPALLKIAELSSFDITKGARVKVLDYLLENYLEYYIPGIKYNAKAVNTLAFSSFKPQIKAFLRGADTDLAPLAGQLMKYFLEANHLTGITTKTPACFICEKIPITCSAKKSKVKSKVASKATAVLAQRLMHRAS